MIKKKMDLIYIYIYKSISKFKAFVSKASIASSMRKRKISKPYTIIHTKLSIKPRNKKDLIFRRENHNSSFNHKSKEREREREECTL